MLGPEDETVLEMEKRFPTATDVDEAIEFGADDGATWTVGKLADHLRCDAAND